MRVTLIQPAVGRKADGSSYPAAWRMEPLGIAALAGATPAGVELSFHDDRLEAIPGDQAADLVGITVETYTARRAYQIAAAFRRRGIRVVLGGFHPTLVPDEAAAHADAIVIGEAEACWTEVLADAAAGNLQPRYESLTRPVPSTWRLDRSIFGRRNYGPVSLVETSRGCRHACEFCSIAGVFRGDSRGRPVGEVAEEVRSLRKPIFFVDDNLGSDPDRLMELCRALLPLGRRWVGQVSLAIAGKEELLGLMRRSGCEGVLIGFESLEAENLKSMGKTVNLAAGDYGLAVRAFRKHGLSIYATFVFGYDQDTAATCDQAFDFALQHKFFFTAFNHLVPFPGTPVYRRLQQEKRLLSEAWWLDPRFRFGDVVFRPSGMSARELADRCAVLRQRFYGLSSILRRGLDWRANCRSPFKTALYFAQNLAHRREIALRQGLPFGVPDAV